MRSLPERQRVTKAMAEDSLGMGIHYSYGDPRPDGAKEALDEADEQYVFLVEEIDWSRIMWEARGRCMRENHVEDDFDPFMEQFPCGACVQAALLVDKSWER